MLYIVDVELQNFSPTKFSLSYCGPHALHSLTASINRSNTAVRAPLELPCSTGGRTGTVRPKQEPTGWTDLSDQSRLVLCDRSQELIGQACPTRRQVLRSDSACPTTGRTRLFEHRSNCRVQPVNAGSEACPTRRQVLWSDSACPTTGRTRLFEHRSNCRVQPVNASSAYSH
ncbi:hypothetical protein PCASD_24988 [Puccinia coronata f. sp. avenae]|uniref:Uncharacterized protein n=1 Tax=Puccinia coronata f. sp. avenae TaxID=200324 RepID=A0A2N5TJ18_9BASI|nr:hypothetical protein PCASD_24988 [Puccinia coronata f. sp. avenae]